VFAKILRTVYAKSVEEARKYGKFLKKSFLIVLVLTLFSCLGIAE